MLVNPYIAGNPVGGSDAFIGRVDVLRSVLRVLKNPAENAIVLFGQRRIGKTSVLQELARSLPHEGPYQPVYFDLQDKAARPLADVLNELAARIAQQGEIPAPSYAPQDAPRLFREAFLPAALEQIARRATPDTSLVLLFDEFDVLDNLGQNQAGAAFFPYLRDLLTFSPRLQFAFVIGRRPEDLSSLTLSVFKGVKAERISLMSADDTAEVVRLSERNGSLRWDDNAVDHVYALTGGHPFLTQQLCQEIWEAAYQDEPAETPTVEPPLVDAAIDATLHRAVNALEWLWDGLRPAQRIVASALAEAGPRAITQEELESQLQKSGVRILVGELQDAPQVLQEWDLIEPTAAGYRFRVELLRRWIVERKPLARVQEEIDYIQPAAENLFQAAYAFYQGGQLEQAVPLLRQAIGLNPNHVRGTQVLSEILLAQGQVDEARQLLESLYQYHPSAARPRLVQALLLSANGVTGDESKLALYERVLALEPNQPEARAGRQQLWLKALTELEQGEKYTEALALGHKLAAELPADHLQRPDLALLERKTQLATRYQRALSALETADRATATQLLSQVVALEPTYREATRHLHRAVASVDANQLAAELNQEQTLRRQREDELAQQQAQFADELAVHKKAHQSAEVALESERLLRQQREKEIEQLHQQLDITRLPPIVKFFRQPPALFTWSLVVLLVSLVYVFNQILSQTGQAAQPTPTELPTPLPSQPAATPDPTRWGVAPPSDPVTGTLWADAVYSITLAYVPAGAFLMGSTKVQTDTALADCQQFRDDCSPLLYEDEAPQHTVNIDGFWIMRTEVTNAQYQKCVEAGACEAPNNHRWNQLDYTQHPVTHINWQQASAYAAWVGGRLPTEAEWEKAARGTTGNLYPWGNDWDGQRLNFCDNQCENSWKDTTVDDGYAGTAPVGSYPNGQSPYGALDMAGNVWEWVADWYAEDYYASSPERNPLGPESGTYRVFRGGSWINPRDSVRAALRYWYEPDDQDDDLGLRVVRSAPPGL